MIESFPSHKTKERDFSPETESFLEEELALMKEDALLEDDFRGRVYSDDFVDGCKLKVEELKKSFESTNKISQKKSELEENFGLTQEYKKASEYLETLFYNNLGGKDGWIPDAVVWKTSEYDDYINGVDFIVETKDREMALATDITFSHTKNLESKLEKIKKEIESGNLPHITFYEPSNGENKILPKVVIAVERSKVIKALNLWAESKNRKEFEGLLKNHPLRAKTMLEIEMQLESFASFAKNIGRRDIASSYNDLLSQIQKLISDHESTIKQYQKIIDDDAAYQTINSFCEKIK